MANKFFPVSIDLNNKNVLIIGAGKIALRKTETLLNYNCNITVITKDILEEKFLELEKNNRIKIFKNQKFEEKFLENIFLVIAATDNEVLNKNISQLCMSKNVLVNNITSKDDMNVRFASIYEKDDIQIAISANANPKKAVEIKNKIKNIFEK
ncbi:precorrin-2 dehydrogenase/sirohydrochlorin ferrochelatase family protein [Fusobacterium nucleatum]|uniref:precorrin-2 dehydrogenase n=2 Tax=Fusobacterium nucleatum subsp. nucleatum TaxID=76856 RepID=Q8R697_FUSNN|nr:bifunctional precorrin-2 dehydrogenase/sirohydrochlorin ferrochelatase [Fusobacterium nucleatum]AAL94735.1 Precorrin-2 oxidase [Fusobacterium nucleatum subsp. nucleatum ATCC 25586]ALF23964.1 ferrochelatase [Fusobacterium nucleatum subsp. nucleatum ChDC F316]ALF25019.1 ferrochelatase [Fusobacterium nucleatum subsp. nucleatum]ASG26704.1 ferrochelatase [Fusobacterium nucleatum subsp. nucleatum]AVQ14979.1 bifunctional precorrin-2 dehydrogenase/sirohydrochlorin ferrochelatase [Fusobacterium nucl